MNDLPGAGGAEPEYRRAHDVAIEALDGETLVWVEEARELHHLNGTTTEIWNACADWARLPAIVASIASSTGRQPSEIASDVAAGVAELAHRQLLRCRWVRDPEWTAGRRWGAERPGDSARPGGE